METCTTGRRWLCLPRTVFHDMGRWKKAWTYTGDLGSVVDKVHSGIGFVTERNFLVHEYLVGEGVEDFGLLMLRCVGSGGVCGTAEGIVFFGAIATRLDGGCEGGDGEGEERE